MIHYRTLFIAAVCLLLQAQASFAHVSNIPHAHEVNPFFALLGIIAILTACLMFARTQIAKSLFKKVVAYATTSPKLRSKETS